MGNPAVSRCQTIKIKSNINSKINIKTNSKRYLKQLR